MTFLRPDSYPFVTLLEESFQTIAGEAARLDSSDYDRWIIEEAFEGSWSIFTLRCTDPTWDFHSTCARNVLRCPETTKLLDRIPGLLLGGFAALGPRSRIHRHRDYPGKPSARCHLGIRIPAGCTLDMAGDVRSWQRGRVLAFDGRTEHCAVNPTDENRVVLLVDVEIARATEPAHG